jgi:hypothetical protein
MLYFFERKSMVNIFIFGYNLGQNFGVSVSYRVFQKSHILIDALELFQMMLRK